VSNPILSIQNPASGYGRSQVLFGVSLSVPSQGAVAILGRNGAGKTTLLETLAGEIRPMSGSIVFDGIDCEHESTERRMRRGLGYVPQNQAVFTSLTVRENLKLGGMADPAGDGFEMALDFFPKLADRLEQKAGTLSGGERKMLAIGRAVLGKPRLLMLDEPTEGVWIGVIEEIADRLVALSKEIALIVVEQHVQLALQVASQAFVMGRGDIVMEGSTAEIRSDPHLNRHLAP